MNWCWYSAGNYDIKIKACEWPSYSPNKDSIFHNLGEFSNNTYHFVLPGGIHLGIKGVYEHYTFSKDLFTGENAAFSLGMGFGLLPKDGKASMLIYLYNSPTINSNFVQGKLKISLRKGCKYRFKVTLTSLSDFQATTNSFGVSFNKDSVFFKDYAFLKASLVPDIDNPRENWFEIGKVNFFEGDFVAKGDEKYFVFGNFHLDDASRINAPFWGMSGQDSIFNYGCDYFISNFSLELDSAFRQKIDLGEDKLLCRDSVVSVTAPSGFYNYRWNTGDTSRTLANGKPGTYTLTADYGCGTAQDQIIVQPYSYLRDLLLKDSVYYKCPDDTLAVEGKPGFFHYQWGNGTEGTILNTSSEGSYVLSAESAAGCLIKDTVEIKNYQPVKKADLGPDITICSDKQVKLSLLPGENNILWSTGSASESIEAVPGLYSVLVYNKCYSQSDSISIIGKDCSEIFIPNVFTPNNDGINDAFHVVTEAGRRMSLRVFDRWGHLVYENSSYCGEWNGENVPDGMYFYELKDPMYDQTLKGPVQVLR